METLKCEFDNGYTVELDVAPDFEHSDAGKFSYVFKVVVFMMVISLFFIFLFETDIFLFETDSENALVLNIVSKVLGGIQIVQAEAAPETELFF